MRLHSGFLVFALVAVVVAVAAHWRLRRYVIACGTSAVITPILFLLISALHDKPPDFLGPKAWAEFAPARRSFFSPTRCAISFRVPVGGSSGFATLYFAERQADASQGDGLAP